MKATPMPPVKPCKKPLRMINLYRPRTEWKPGDTCYIYDQHMKCRRPAKVLEEYDAKRFGYQLGHYYVVEFSCHVDCWMDLVSYHRMFETETDE
jgi:hypothetical protein